MKRLYDSLSGCKKEEEVKSEFCKFFRRSAGGPQKSAIIESRGPLTTKSGWMGLESISTYIQSTFRNK